MVDVKGKERSRVDIMLELAFKPFRFIKAIGNKKDNKTEKYKKELEKLKGILAQDNILRWEKRVADEMVQKLSNDLNLNLTEKQKDELNRLLANIELKMEGNLPERFRKSYNPMTLQ